MSYDTGKAKSIFLSAIEGRSPAQWPEFLDGACADDTALRAEVERLLRAHSHLGTFDERSREDTAIDPPITEKPGTRIDHYKLVEQIGEGGFGVVFLAEQEEPIRRKVAVKIIKPGMDTKEVIARFTAERQALAMMDHPNISRVFDAGATESGRPYFVMELVRGVSITEYCDRNRLDAEKRLRLFVTVCQAVQHAHQKGVIHRDIKPGNVMITIHDGQPIVKVIDFGIAKAVHQKLTEKTLTGYGRMMGTPQYMSPEQAAMGGLDIDTRSDVYSLGVLLYELLTGTTPVDKQRFQEAAYDEVRRIICEEEPAKPSAKVSTLGETAAPVFQDRRADPQRLSTLIRGDLDWIVMKALEKDRSRRYETANGLASDVRRYLSHEPVTACPPSASYRLRKFARRNRAALVTVAAVAVALVLGLVISTWQAVRATKAERLAQQESENSKKEASRANAVVALLSEMLESANPDQAKGADYTVRELLDDFSRGLDDQLQDQPDVEATVRATIGNAYRRLALPEEAEPHLKAALDLRRRVFGDEHEMVAESLLDYAFNCWERDRQSAEAVAKAREALAIYRKLGGRNEGAIRALRYLQLFLGDNEKGDQAAKEALAIAEALEIREHPDVASILHTMARTRISQGDYAEAESLSRRALGMHRKVHGNNHPETAFALNTLADALRARGKTEEATTHYGEAIPIFNKQFGGGYRGADAAIRGLAKIFQANGDADGAESIWRETLTFRREQFGDAHPSVVAALTGLAMMLRSRSDHAGLEAVWREILAIRREQFEPGHVSCGIALSRIAYALKGQGDPWQAESYYQEALAVLEGCPDDVDGQIELADALIEYGSLLHDAGRPLEADRRFEQAIALLHTLIEESTIEATGPVRTRSALQAMLGNVHLRTKDFAQAVAHLTMAIETSSFNGRAYLLRSTAFFNTEEYHRSLEDAENAVRFAGGWYSYLRRAMAHQAVKQYDEALADYEFAEEIARDPYEIYRNRAEMHLVTQAYEQAVGDLDRALKIRPTWTCGYQRLALAHYHLGQFEQALAAVRSAVELDPGEEPGYFLEWMFPDGPESEESRRFRSEAQKIVESVRDRQRK